MKKTIFYYVIVAPLVLVLLTFAAAYWVFWAPLQLSRREFVIAKGDTVLKVAERLQAEGYVRSAMAFRVAAKLNSASLQAGRYQLDGRFNAWSLLAQLRRGPEAGEEKQILIKEGMNNRSIEAYLSEQSLISDGSFLRLAGTMIADLPDSYRQRYAFLAEAPQRVDLEGFLFPDTYRLFAKDGGQALVDKMLDNFDRKLTPTMRADIKAQGKRLYDILIMASIVEKEVRSTDDMKTVAGIFYNRLTNGQRLESCATLAYILGVNKPQYSYEDTQVDSPFNTYRHQGLPPTPIGNPGLRAIEAAIYPHRTDYQFFLSDPATGQTIWARTFEEHVRNKERYLR